MLDKNFLIKKIFFLYYTHINIYYFVTLEYIPFIIIYRLIRNYTLNICSL